MELSKYRLGELIEQCDERNTKNDYLADDVRGISTEKSFIATKANLNGVSLTSYKVVKHGEFAYVADTSRRGDKIALAFNSTKNEILISSIYTVFRVTRVDLLDADYLFMYFNRPEFDRYSRFNSWGSARETFDWSEMCDIEIDLPPLDIQQKYVDVYNAMLANQQSYERGLEDLKLTCDAYIEELRRNTPSVAIGKYLMPSDERNTLNLSADSVRGLSVSKDMIERRKHISAEEAGATQEQASEDIIKNATEQALQILRQMNESRESFRKIGLTFEEKAFYDILVSLRDQYNFEYGEDKEIGGMIVNDKCKILAKKVKEIIDTKSSFSDWLNNQNVRNQLKLDIKICLVKNGYPPQYSPEVFTKVMEQVENFEENSDMPMATTYTFPQSRTVSMVAEDIIPYGNKSEN